MAAGININGILPVQTLNDMAANDARDAAAHASAPGVQGLAQYVRSCWEVAKQAKQQGVEERLLHNLRQRRGEYDPDVLAEIKAQGSSEIFMMLTSNKCRAASAWLRDTLLGARDEKCWAADATPMPDLPEEMRQAVIAEATQDAETWYNTGLPMTREMMYELTLAIKDRQFAEATEEAKKSCARMELKMEDQLVEGGFQAAFSAFIDDLVTFPSAILKGPVIRRKPKLTWGKALGGMRVPQVVDNLVTEWDRVDPMMAYPSPGATTTEDGFFIERHRLSRTSLSELIGVDGYDAAAIRAVLAEYGRGGLHEWLFIDSAKADAEGRNQAALDANPEASIDAIQFWGSVQGSMLQEWGMTDITDAVREYHCEVWLIGTHVIKSTLNYDPLNRRPYFKTSYEEVPGAFWGNAIPDLINDCQSMCNSAARSLANNMGIASGPQVVYNIDRLPSGYELTQMHPWKLWQVDGDPFGGSAKPVEFYQPNLLADQLMMVYDRFAMMADEYSGIPRYMTGDNAGIGGAGRTASGMSMLMGNAGKTIKQVISNIDVHVVMPMIERLYTHNMLYADDPDLKGDVNIRARGANALMVKDAAQVRRNEFLQVALSNPVAQQVVGMEGIAALLHEQAKTLDMDADKIVPPPEVLKRRQEAQQAQQAQPQPQQSAPRGNQQTLMTGEPVTDTMAMAA